MRAAANKIFEYFMALKLMAPGAEPQGTIFIKN
jgi:hypothetical protein